LRSSSLLGLASSKVSVCQDQQPSYCIQTSPSPSANTNIEMNEIISIEDIQTSLKETKDLIDAIYRKYQRFPDVEHSQTVAALVHLVGKELEMIIANRKSAIELNQILQGRIREFDESTNNLRIALSEAEKEKRAASAAEKRLQKEAARVAVGDLVEKKVRALPPSSVLEY